MTRLAPVFSALAALAALTGLSAAGCAAEVPREGGESQDESAGANAIEQGVTTPDYRRTVVYVVGETQPGQDMFVRGGLDYPVAKAKLGYDCAKTPSLCTIPIKHRSTKNATTAGWKQGDTTLDWGAAEPKQGRAANGAVAQGSPLDWTTNYWPSDWGPEKTIDHDGFGVDAMNRVGMHAWKLDVDMDCARALPDAAGNRWFELKSFISNGPGWERDAHQPGAPYASGNHFAQCGEINVLWRGADAAQVYGFTTPKSISCDGGALVLKPSSSGPIGDMVPWDATLSDAKAIDYFVAQSQTTFDFYEPSANCGQPFHATITKHLPYSVTVSGAGSARTLVATGLYSYTNGASFASGQYGVQVDPSVTAADGLKVTIDGVDMPCSHSAAGYEVGTWSFAHCVARY
jgi:hypothetical protein